MACPLQKACHREVSAETPSRAAAAIAEPQHTRAGTLHSSCTIAGNWGGRCTGGGAVRGVHREQSRHCVPVRAHVCVRALCHRPAVMPHLPQALPANPSIPDLRWQLQLSYSHEANLSPLEWFAVGRRWVVVCFESQADTVFLSVADLTVRILCHATGLQCCPICSRRSQPFCVFQT